MTNYGNYFPDEEIMSSEYRTPEEYLRLYASRNHKSIEQAEKSIAVSLFKDYAKEREKDRQDLNKN